MTRIVPTESVAVTRAGLGAHLLVLEDGIRLSANSSAPPVTTLEPISTGRSGDLTDLRFKIVR